VSCTSLGTRKGSRAKSSYQREIERLPTWPRRSTKSRCRARKSVPINRDSIRGQLRVIRDCPRFARRGKGRLLSLPARSHWKLVWLRRGTLVPWGVTTRKPAFGVILLGLLCEQCSTSRPDRLCYPHSRPFRRRQLRRKADYAWHVAASVRLQIAKPLRMSASGLRSQGSGEIDS
jgi:hypothetical protein